MNRRGSQSNNAKVTNPVLRIPFSSSDLGTIDVTGGGSKELVDVTPEYRQGLVGNLSSTKQYLQSKLSSFPGSMGTIVFKLREQGIAKSHRPNKLAREAGLQNAGHAKIDEMLVAAHSGSFDVLETVILHRNIKQIVANLSAIERIEPWDESRKLPYGKVSLFEASHILVRLFQYSGEDATGSNYNSILNLLEDGEIEFSEIRQRRGLPLLRLKNLTDFDHPLLQVLIDHPGVRTLIPEPRYSAFPVSAGSTNGSVVSDFQSPNAELPIVAVFDTGVSPVAVTLTPWVTSHETYVVPPDTRYEHGTMVSSLVSGANHINDGHAWIPSTRSKVHDVCALEENGSYTSDLILRLTDAVSKRPDIKVWNLSLGGGPCDQNMFSEFAMTLDKLSDQYGILFVLAAGNYLSQPRRTWPNPHSLNNADLISSPGESVRALTVGSVSHLDAAGSLSSVGTPTPYSRRGPGPIFTPKPDIVHAGGGVHAPWAPGLSSLKVLGPDNRLTSSFGTSFSAPIVSSLAAHTWQKIDSNPEFSVSPSLVKALLIHSAQLSSPDYSTNERRYYGAGLPEEIIETLHDSDERFTLVFQTLLVPGMRWRKENYPIPASLLDDGKFKGEIIITAAYAPPLDPNAGSEYVRANVELSFGLIENNSITGKVPMEGETGQSGYESAQIEHGGKWSPVKIHRKKFSRGITSGNWAIQAKATLRANEPPLRESLPVTIIVTLRSIDGNNQVYADGVRALNSNNWVYSSLPVRMSVNV
ncbi:S8 family peptidase [Klebsiella quasipneumoniae]|uniref:S8 family anti-phage peptidase IteS n=1 Tax=Klebsiella pneumoniae complex TaxID=3390273 RepID=UPI00103403F3|nr:MULTISPECIES: S8 family anti-phage peptidase IteS [Klebsiella]MCL8072049.1 S8 family peptidase [Klebsiella quasipneumoniae]MDM7369895.1 S8 family peptidase [Klebsiella quasipneumoniae]HDS6011528.1 S8 family peptidase [Klebsiella variicola]